jgi:hypothetical protein
MVQQSCYPLWVQLHNQARPALQMQGCRLIYGNNSTVNWDLLAQSFAAHMSSLCPSWFHIIVRYSPSFLFWLSFTFYAIIFVHSLAKVFGNASSLNLRRAKARRPLTHLCKGLRERPELSSSEGRVVSHLPAEVGSLFWAI